MTQQLKMLQLKLVLPIAKSEYVPSRAAIETGLGDVPKQISPNGDVKWLSPKPRIVREADAQQVVTQVQWPLEGTLASSLDLPGIETLMQKIADSAKAKLADAARNEATPTVELLPFDTTVYGSATNWQSGQATATLTADTAAGPGQRRDDPNRPNVVLDGNTPTNWTKIALAGGAVLLGGYLIVQATSSKNGRSNPSGRGRKQINARHYY